MAATSAATLCRRTWWADMHIQHLHVLFSYHQRVSSASTIADLHVSGCRWSLTDISLLPVLRCGVCCHPAHPLYCSAPRREYNRRVREVVEQSWIEQDT